MSRLSVRIDKASDFIGKDEIRLFESEVELHLQQIHEKTGKGNDFLGWVDLPSATERDLVNRILADAERLREVSDAVVVVGIGGSYLGTRAVTGALSGTLEGPATGEGRRGRPRLHFAGHHLDAGYLNELLRHLDGCDYSLVVISKSGTTTEPAIAFRLLKQHLEHKYGSREAGKRIIAVTDASRGALKKLADAEGYPTYVIPDDVGGRYSVLTPVGLLPIAIAGHDMVSLLEGARDMEDLLKKSKGVYDNPAALYAVARNILYRKGKTTEILASYEPSLFYLAEWWKQLFGESEGKEQKGIFPASVGFTTDLHSLGQYIQEGLRNLFETVIRVETGKESLLIPFDPDDSDGLNFLAGKDLREVNHMALAGTQMAHLDGGVPNLEIVLPDISARSLGELMYFFEMSCALSGYILGVNPFDQPGVEAYKRNMFALLGKPGFGEQGKTLRERIKGFGV
jgi:glucose-6-phosphate isomerase